MENKRIVLSTQRLKQLEDELAILREKRNVEIPQKIREAREQGDLSENAEYDAAKDEQRETEARIEEIEQVLKYAEVIAYDDIDTTKIGVGCTVTLLSLSDGSKIKYTIVGNFEADSLNGMISHESPLGAALVGATKGTIVSVEAPVGELKFEVLDITKTD